MSSGQNAADQTKGAFKGINDASEGLRNNINSAADNLLGGNKQHGGADIHPDAKKTGSGIEKGVEAAGKKLNEMTDKQHR